MRKIKFIHFVTDEKFINDEIRCFNDAKLCENKYYYVGSPKESFKFIDSNVVNVIEKKEILQVLSQEFCEVVCLHNLFSVPINIISLIPDNISVVWYAWGFDLYSNPKPNGPLIDISKKFMPITKQILDSTFDIKKYIRPVKLWIEYLCGKKNLWTKKNVEKALTRIDYFAGVFENEYELLLESYPSFRAKKIVHNYIHPEEFLKEEINEPLNITGKNILLGNSASCHNNHLDVIMKMKDFICEESQIIMPLSYQIKKEYVNQVLKISKKQLGEKLIPLMKFLPFEDYTRIMNSCDTIILGQMQQAATCNCLTAMWSGLRLFLPKESMNYIYYKSLGFIVYSIEDDYQKNPTLTDEDIKKNRILIERLYSYRSWKVDLEKFIDILNKTN